MPAVPYIDRIDTLNMVEKNAAARSMTRRCRVIWDNTKDWTPTYYIMQEALSVCPAAYTSPIEPELSNLVLVERHPEVVDVGIVDVTLKYEHVLDGANQDLYAPTTGLIFVKGRGSVTQKPTNFFYAIDKNTRQRTRVQILTAHTFLPIQDPATGAWLNDPDFGGLPNVLQGGEVNVPFPESNARAFGVVFSGDPWAVVSRYLRSTNAKIFMDQPIGTWMITGVDFDMLRTNNLPGEPLLPLYRFDFEFQNNIDGWNPMVVFNDTRTGRPPANSKFAGYQDPNYNSIYVDDNGNSLPIYNQAINPYQPSITDPDTGDETVNLQPADAWIVPYFPQLDWEAEFRAWFEGSH